MPLIATSKMKLRSVGILFNLKRIEYCWNWHHVLIKAASYGIWNCYFEIECWLIFPLRCKDHVAVQWERPLVPERVLSIVSGANANSLNIYKRSGQSERLVQPAPIRAPKRSSRLGCQKAISIHTAVCYALYFCNPFSRLINPSWATCHSDWRVGGRNRIETGDCSLYKPVPFSHQRWWVYRVKNTEIPTIGLWIVRGTTGRVSEIWPFLNRHSIVHVKILESVV